MSDALLGLTGGQQRPSEHRVTPGDAPTGRSAPALGIDRHACCFDGLVRLSEGSLDAIHLASALDLSPLPDAFLCYDDRLAHAARENGLTVVSPGRDQVHEP